MPEINSKRNPQTGNRKKRKSKPKSKSYKKKKLLPGQRKVDWGSREEKTNETKVTRTQWYLITALLAFIILFILWAFVPDRQTLQKRAAQRKAEQEYLQKRAKKHEELSKRSSSFQYANLLNSSAFSFALKNMHDGEFDRIMLVAFDDSTREAEANPLKVKLFKKCESLAKSLPRKSLFKRYDEEDLPMIVLFDCGNPNDPAAENVCKQIIGDNIPNQLIFRTQQQPRQLPSDQKSQKQIMQYLFNLMQPAVKYLEELVDAEDFIADDKYLNAVLFGTDDPSHTFEQIADGLRDYARFARTKNPTIIEAFDLDIKLDLPSLMIWRTFGENPHLYTGNLSHAQSVRDWVMNNFVPVFGEFTPRTSAAYMKRGLPILWIAYNPDRQSKIELTQLLATIEALAHQYIGHLTFTQLDVKSQPQIASNFGLDVARLDGDGDEDEDEDEDDSYDNENDDRDTNLPQAFIMNQIAQVHEVIDLDDIEGSVEKVVDSYMRTLRAHRGDVLPDLQEDLDDYSDDYEVDEDDDLLEDDDDDEDEELDDEESELEDEEEEEDEMKKEI